MKSKNTQSTGKKTQTNKQIKLMTDIVLYLLLHAQFVLYVLTIL